MASSERVFDRLDPALPADRAALGRLIADVFALDVTPLDRLGHDPSVVSFCRRSGDGIVANASLYRQTVWCLGTAIEALALQSVAVVPAWRGRGLFRGLMERAIAHADARVPLLTLATATPDLYRRFGFRSVEETVFLGEVASAATPAARRRLDLDDDRDVALIRDLVARRSPVSLVGGVVEHPALFFLKAVESPEIGLVHLPDLDAVVAVEEGGAVPGLLDVVASEIPSLAAIAAALGWAAGPVGVKVTPDRLGWTPSRLEREDTGLMVRGSFPIDGQAFMWSTMRV